MSDNINHPSHYADGWSNGAEVIDITENLNFNRGNAVKYIARAGKKNPDTELEDLWKAHWYIKRELQRLDPPREPEPRQWTSINDVPVDVILTGIGSWEGYVAVSGSVFRRFKTDNPYRRYPAETLVKHIDTFGPFTEVVE